jgi:hypothetical protein
MSYDIQATLRIDVDKITLELDLGVICFFVSFQKGNVAHIFVRHFPECRLVVFVLR